MVYGMQGAINEMVYGMQGAIVFTVGVLSVDDKNEVAQPN